MIGPQVVHGVNQSLQTPVLPVSRSQSVSDSNSTTGSSTANATKIPIVVKPIKGGSCPLGYYMVSGSVCIKDITLPAPQTTSTASTPSPLHTTNLSKSSPLPLPSASQLNVNATNSDQKISGSSNDENFNTKILKSFNKEFKRQNR
jgi:hypothetical protein